MTALKIFILAIAITCLSGCFEMNEEIEVNANGSGNFAVKMDMGQLVDMIQAFMPAEELENANREEARDTTIQMKDLVDSASNISPDKKAVLRDGSMHLQMNLKAKIFKVDVRYPFNTPENLQKLYDNLGEGSSGLGNLLKGLNPAGAGPSGGEPDLKMLSAYFDLVAKKGLLTRKLNKEKYAFLGNDSTMQQMKQMGSMGGGLEAVKMNTTIRLPAAAKKSPAQRLNCLQTKKASR